MTVIQDPVYAWAEVIKRCHLPVGFVGLLISVEVAAYTSTLSALINWGGSFVINDIYRPLDPQATVKREIWVSRLTTLVLFVAASVVAILFVKQMVGWFMFINSAMVICSCCRCRSSASSGGDSTYGASWRPSCWACRLSILVWFVLDFQNPAKHPMWQGLGLLFGLSFLVLICVTLLTPPESHATLRAFYQRCWPPGFWGPVRGSTAATDAAIPPTGRLVANSLLGMLACLGLVLATNAIFVGDWLRVAGGLSAAALLGAWLVQRMFVPAPPTPRTQPQTAEAAVSLDQESV